MINNTKEVGTTKFMIGDVAPELITDFNDYGSIVFEQNKKFTKDTLTWHTFDIRNTKGKRMYFKTGWLQKYEYYVNFANFDNSVKSSAILLKRKVNVYESTKKLIENIREKAEKKLKEIFADEEILEHEISSCVTEKSIMMKPDMKKNDVDFKMVLYKNGKYYKIKSPKLESKDIEEFLSKKNINIMFYPVVNISKDSLDNSIQIHIKIKINCFNIEYEEGFDRYKFLPKTTETIMIKENREKIEEMKEENKVNKIKTKMYSKRTNTKGLKYSDKHIIDFLCLDGDN